MAVKNESSSIKSSGSTAARAPPVELPGVTPQVGERERDAARKRAKERVRRLTQSPATGEERGSEVNASDGSANTNRRGNANTRSTLPPASFYPCQDGSRPSYDGSGSAIGVVDRKVTTPVEEEATGTHALLSPRFLNRRLHQMCGFPRPRRSHQSGAQPLTSSR